MVMRGFVEGIKKIGPTQKFIQKIVSKPDGSAYSVSVIIDPILFRKYGVNRVPCIVYDRSVAADIHADADSDNYYLMYGDASLEYAIERIQKESHGETLNAVLSSLRGGIYK
jgi:type-F conjugative transfer system pilin assembly protein TrbC